MLLQLSAYFNDIKNAEVYSEVLGWMQNNDRQNDVDYQAFMATGNDRFLRLLLFAMTYQMTWFEHIRGEFFLVLPETNVSNLILCSSTICIFTFDSILQNLFIKKEVNRIVCLFQMYFEYEVLCEVDRRAFLPWWQTPKVSKMQFSTEQCNELIKYICFLRAGQTKYAAKTLPGEIGTTTKLVQPVSGRTSTRSDIFRQTKRMESNCG